MGIFRFSIVAAAVALSAGAAKAEELRVTIGQAGDSALVQGVERFAENLGKETEGAYTGKLYAGSLLNYAETLTGLRDGITDVGFIVVAYHRAELPSTNLVVDAATLSTDPVVMAGAVNEYVMLECAPCQQEFANEGQVFLGLTVTGPYYLMSVNRVGSRADFSGRKYRGFGPFGRWIAAMGGTPVVLSANDIYEAISQGQVDGNTHIVDVLKSLSLGEVTDYLLNEPIGLFTGNATINVSRLVWDNLSDDEKRAFLRAAGDSHAWTTVSYFAENQAYLDDAAAVGVELIEPDEDLRAASAKFRNDDLATVIAENVEQHGVADAEARIARLRELVTKWEGLIAGIDKTDTAAVSALYLSEIFSRVDPASLN
ncbi:MAG: C4-dicarboxylate TRAP transporter substrate-binding protein [Pikeienuella sp.]